MRFFLLIALMSLGLESMAQVRVFNSLTNLLATDPNAYMTGNRLDVAVLGFRAPSDWGPQRGFTTTTDGSGLSTNRGHVFRNTVQPSFWHVSTDQLADRQDARWFGLLNATNVSAYTTVQAAADYCSMTSATDRSRTLVIPKGDYATDRTIIIKGSLDALDATFHVFVPGFPGTNAVAFQLGDPSLDVRYAKINPPSVEWHGNTHSDGSASFEFREINYSEITLARTFGSQDGIRINPTIRGFAYNRVRLGQHREHKRTLALLPNTTGSGFVNDNLFDEGSYFTPRTSLYISNNVAGAPGYAAIVTRYGGSGGDVNNNIFFKPVIEGSAYEYMVDIEGRNNLVFWQRDERQSFDGTTYIPHINFHFDTNRVPSTTLPTHYNRVIMGFMSPESQLVISRTGNTNYVVDNFVEYQGQQFAWSDNGIPMVKLQQMNPGGYALGFYPSDVDPNLQTNWTTSWGQNFLRFKNTNDVSAQFFIRATDGVLGWGAGGTNSSDIFLQKLGPDLTVFPQSGGLRVSGPRGLAVNTLPSSNYVATFGGTLPEHNLALIYNDSTNDHSAAGWFIGSGPNTNQVYGGIAQYPTNYFQPAVSNRLALRSFTANSSGLGIFAPYAGQTIDLGGGELFPRVQITPLGLKINAGALNTYAATTHPIKFLAGFPDNPSATGRDLEALAPGAAGKLLGSDGTQVVWMDPPAGGGGGIAEAPIDGLPYGRQSASWVNLNSLFATASALALKQPLDSDLTDLAAIVGSSGDLIMRSGTNWTRLPIATNGLVLTVAGGLPSWAAPAAGGFADAPSDGSPYGRQSGSWTNLNLIYGKLADTNLWTGASNHYTGALSAGGVRIDPTGIIGINGSPTAGIPLAANITNAGASYLFLKNFSTDPASAAGFYSTAGGIDGALFTYPLTASVAGYAGRLVMRPFTSGANGMALYTPYATQTIDLGVGVSTPQVRLISTNLSVTTTTRLFAPTGAVSHFAMFADDPTGTGGNVRSITPANAAATLKPTLDTFYPAANSRSGFRYWDEFLNPTQTIGDSGTAGLANSGIVIIPGSVQAGRPGLRTIRTAAAGQVPLFGWYYAALTFRAPAIGSLDQYYYETALQMTSSRSGFNGDEYAIRMGFTSHQTGTNAAADGVWLTHQTNLVSSSTWVFQTSSNNVVTSVDTGVAVNVNAWYRLGVYLDSTNAYAFVNGNLVATNTVASGTLPLTKGLNAIAEFPRFGGTTTLDINLDWMNFTWNGAAR